MRSSITYYSASREENNVFNYNLLQCSYKKRKIMRSTIVYYSATREENNAVNYNLLQCN